MALNRRAKVLHRCIVRADTLANLLALCERTADPVWIAKERLDRCTLRGVPAKQIDLAIAPTLGEWAIVEVADKAGRYDGAIRCRLTVRSTDATPVHQLDRLPEAALLVQSLPDRIVLAIVASGIAWTATYQTLRSTMEDYSPARLVTWHWARYYRHLSYDDVQPLAESFAATHPELAAWTLAEANRAASRDLYELSRQLGWRKLAMRERVKYGLTDHGQWVKQDFVERRRQEIGYTSSGCGQYSVEAAAGNVPMREEISTAYGVVTVQ